MAKDAGTTVVPLTEADLSRQAELVVMEYLKSTRCAKTLDAMMSIGTRSSSVSPMSSDMYAEDMERKKKSGAKSVLDYLVSKMVDEVPAETRLPSPSSLDRTLSRSNRSSSKSSSSRRRASTDDSSDEKASTIDWTREEVQLLRKAIKQTGDIDDKNERWKQIANIVGNGKTKKHCYLKYKDLKEERSSSRSPSNSERSRSRRSSSDEKSHEHDSAAKALTVAPDAIAKSIPSEIPSARHTQDAENEPAYAVRHVPSAALTHTTTKPTGAETLEVEDCEDFDSAPVVPASRSGQGKLSSSSATAPTGRSPSMTEIESLRDILFPEDRKSFSSHWEEQGFSFSNTRNLRYGLIQHQGGPCGVLAVVQAYVLRFLLESVRPSDWRNPSQRDQEQALIEALSHIMWQAARGSRRTECMIVINDDKAQSMSSSAKRKFMANMQVFTTKSVEQTKALLTQHVRQFMAPRGNGLVLLVLSALLSKRVETIKPEMDSVEGALGGGGKLIGGHDYCTQEIVNLLLCGVASSNVFNGKQLLEGVSEDDAKAVVLKGIPARCDVGFLSLFEAYEYIVVGSHLKVPRFNVFVVCSESHYSVLFADPKLLTSDAIHDDTPQLDVFYFDGLGNQDEEIRLTVHTSALSVKLKPKPDDLVPPLNLVLQTKWPLARIDWNGVDPLL